jgi:magnesium transporter
MKNNRKKTERKRVSLPPGTLVYVGEAKEGPAHLHAVIYDADRIEKRLVTSDAISSPENKGVTWLQVEGVHDVDTVKRIGEVYGLHMLALEDIVNTDHRAKLDEYDGAAFLILKHLREDSEHTLRAENISIVLMPHVVLSFSVNPQDVFEPVRARIEMANGRFRSRGADYLFYTLLDSVVDHYVAIIETFDDELESLEDEILLHPSRSSVHRLHALRHRILLVRKAALPLRESVIQLSRNEDSLVSADVLPFLRDVLDHLSLVLESLEHDTEVLSGLLDLYEMHESNKMNEAMKVLTMIATVFIPLTFIAGIYGMNFRHMPELKQPWAYPAVLLLMLVVVVALLFYFRKKRWL